jgi:hypothetical protein
MENILLILIAIFVVIFILVIVSNSISIASSPRLAREARVIGKRLYVSGGTNGSSTYYATFEFPDGSREEFRVSSQIYGMIAEGDMGTLESQGTYMSNFNRRV